MTSKFHERFEIELGVEEGKRRFVNRTLNFIFEHMMDLADRKDTWQGKTDLAAFICSKLGERATGVSATEKLINGDLENAYSF